MRQNTEAERAFLGCYMLDRHEGRYQATQHGIDVPEAYTDPACIKIMDAITKLEKLGKPVELVSLSELLGKGSMEKLEAICDGVGSTNYSEHYAEQVAEAYEARQGAARARALVAALEDPEKNPRNAMNGAAADLLAIGKNTETKIHKAGSFEMEKIAQWERAEKGESLGVPFCIPEINHYLGGLRYGIMSVLAAYRGTGKSTLGRQVAHHAATEGYPAIAFTLEDPADMADAFIAGSQAGVSVFHLDTGQSGKSHRDRIAAGFQEIGKLPLWLVDRNCGIAAMGAIVERMVREQGVKLVIVDHIQYIAPNVTKGMNRTDTLAHYSSCMCGWAKEYGLHVMALSQLSNDGEKQNRKRVRMSDIRGCGAIADDARQVLALYYDDGHQLEVLKNNFGMSDRGVFVERCDGLQKFKAADGGS